MQLIALLEFRHSTTLASLPTLDFSKFTHGSHLEQLNLGNALFKSFKDHGFVKLINHGLPNVTTEALLEFVG